MKYKRSNVFALALTILSFSLLTCSPSLLAAKKTVEITDQLGRHVVIPEKVDRIVILMHHALIISLELGAKDQIVGVLERWPKYISAGIKKAWPEIDDIPTPGDLRTVNIEEVLKLNPDLVIVTHYAIETVGKQLATVGVPVIGISLYKAEYEEASVLNPKLKDPDKAYTEGLFEGIMLLGRILDKTPRARLLVERIKENRKLVEDRIDDLDKSERKTTYMAYPNLYTMGHGKYAMVIMERSGGINVAAEMNGYKKVNMEDVLNWNPEVIFTQQRYAFVSDEIQKTDAWKPIKAVKTGQVYITPEYVKPWGHPCPESLALGELWMAKKLHPDLFNDIDMQQWVDEFYRTFYGVSYTGGH